MWNWISGTGAPAKSNDDATVAAADIEDDNPTDAEASNAETVRDDAGEEQRSSRDENATLKDTAATVGSFLFNVASAATKTASKLKETVDHKLDKTIIGDFQRENDKFVQEKRNRTKEEPLPPWVGYLEEEEMKSQILSLSTDDRNFFRDPPSGVDFHFDVDTMMPVAIATLREDKNLSDMRFKLVPQKVKEERFWRNYFYRVSLIKQKSQLSRLAESETKRNSSGDSSEKLNNMPESGQQSNRDASAAKDIVSMEISSALEETTPDSPTSHEFASDAYTGELQQGLSMEEMNQLNMKDQDNAAGPSEWEKELQNELQEFEFVNDNPEDGDEAPDPNWEKEIEDMLGLEGES